MVCYAFFLLVNERIQANNNNNNKKAVAIIYKLCYGLSQLCNSARLETVTGLHNSTPDKLSMKDPSAPKKNATIYGSISCTRILTTVLFGSSSLRPQLYSLLSLNVDLHEKENAIANSDQPAVPSLLPSTLNCFQKANLLRTPSLGIKP